MRGWPILIVVLAAVPASAQDARVATWLASLQANDWDVSTTGADTISYSRPNPHAPQGLHWQWERYEFENPKAYFGFSYRSEVDLIEYDCNGRDRPLDRNFYAEINMAGDVARATGLPGPWAFIVPGTIAASMETTACAPSVRELERAYRKSLKGKPGK